MGLKPGHTMQMSHMKPPTALKESFAKYIYHLHLEARSIRTHPSHRLPGPHHLPGPAPEEPVRGHVALRKRKARATASPSLTWRHL